MNTELELPIREIVSRYKAGESGRQIAKAMSCSQPTVYERLRKAGVTVRPANPKLNLMGKVYGRLAVIKRAGKTPRGEAKWLVECSCPAHTRRVVRGNDLRQGKTKSCQACPNEHKHLAGGVTVIEITRRNGVKHQCVIDTPDYVLVKGYRWAVKRGQNTYYAETGTGGKKRRIHQILFPDAPNVDHRDWNGLNNRRSNLRPATKSQNNAYRRKRERTSSQFIGVTWVERHQKWVATVREQGKKIHLGSFISENNAARARDAAALRLYGEFAVLNFPKKSTSAQVSL